MSFTIEEQKTYSHPKATVFQTALAAIEGLEGKIESQDADTGVIDVKFHKTILGKVLGDRTHFVAEIVESSPEETSVNVTVYPLDAVGRKLLFGARKGVSKTVATWFFAHLEHRLPK